jgi:hypothetical protein
MPESCPSKPRCAVGPVLAQRLLAGLDFPEASLELLETRALQRRFDTKFVLDLPKLREVLASLTSDFALLWTEGQPIARYRTLYFDTPDHHCLKEHHRGRRPRYKIRVRHYPERKLSYLEVKCKTSADSTVKARRPMPYTQEHLGEEESAFVEEHSPLLAASLIPSLRTTFGRITLVGLHTQERATIDLNLGFEGGGVEEGFPLGVIAEIKQARPKPRSPILLAFRSAGVRSMPVSKYCTAAMLLLPDVPMNRYRPTLRVLRSTSDD